MFTALRVAIAYVGLVILAFWYDQSQGTDFRLQFLSYITPVVFLLLGKSV